MNTIPPGFLPYWLLQNWDHTLDLPIEFHAGFGLFDRCQAGKSSNHMLDLVRFSSRIRFLPRAWELFGEFL